jgi:hypothetical protein
VTLPSVDLAALEHDKATEAALAGKKYTHIDELRFASQSEKHELPHLYEAKIKNMILHGIEAFAGNL